MKEAAEKKPGYAVPAEVTKEVKTGFFARHWWKFVLLGVVITAAIIAAVVASKASDVVDAVLELKKNSEVGDTTTKTQ